MHESARRALSRVVEWVCDGGQSVIRSLRPVGAHSCCASCARGVYWSPAGSDRQCRGSLRARMLWPKNTLPIRRESDIPISFSIPCSHDISSELQHETAMSEVQARSAPRYKARRYIPKMTVHIMTEAATLLAAHVTRNANTNRATARGSMHTLVLRRVAVIGFS
jgi:hypothetical protein